MGESRSIEKWYLINFFHIWIRVYQEKEEGFPGGMMVRISLLIREMQVQSLDGEDPLEEEMATYSSNLA